MICPHSLSHTHLSESTHAPPHSTPFKSGSPQSRSPPPAAPIRAAGTARTSHPEKFCRRRVPARPSPRGLRQQRDGDGDASAGLRAPPAPRPRPRVPLGRYLKTATAVWFLLHALPCCSSTP